jgi:hypothetical protein
MQYIVRRLLLVFPMLLGISLLNFPGKHKLEQRALAQYKYQVFRDFVRMPMHQFDQRLNDKRYPCVQFATLSSPLFSEWHHKFYEEGRKRLPEEMSSLLDPLCLAGWFMDDGAADHCGLTIQTHNFLREEVEMAAETMEEKFDLAVNLRSNKKRWLIYIRSISVEGFRQLVEPHVLPDLRYKLVPRKAL